jgi:hypothetical protein
MRFVTLMFGVISLAGSAQAQAQNFNSKDFMTANEAGQIIGGADICGYKLDDAKTATFMESTVAALDDTARMHFNNTRALQVQAFSQMSSTEKKAQCALQAKLAQKYGITP